MKVVAFNVPQIKKEAFRLQLDRGRHFYDQLHQHSEIQIMWIEEGEGTLIAGDYVGRLAITLADLRQTIYSSLEAGNHMCSEAIKITFSPKAK